jgi:LysR family transcriptional regulator, hydrogen peroxide-inducible genes activator
MVSLRQLRYLAALAEHGTSDGPPRPARCRSRRCRCKSAISSAISASNLVERRPGEVAFTDVGAEVVRRAEQVLAATRDLEDFARHGGRLLTGRLRLGVIPSLAPYVLPVCCRNFSAAIRIAHPAARDPDRSLLNELSGGDLDVALLALPVDESDLETARLFEDPFLLAVPAADPRSRQRSASAPRISIRSG